MADYIFSPLPVQFWRQDDQYSCALACAEMILVSVGVPSATVTQDQIWIYIATNHFNSIDHGVDWQVAPDQLNFALNHFKGAFGGTFTISENKTVDDASCSIVRAIFDHKVAPTALVWGMKHWIVVVGFTTDVEPTTSASYTIKTFIVNDPAFSGHMVIDYQTWIGHNKHNRRDARMTGVPIGKPPGSDNRSKWHGEFIAVCDPMDNDEEQAPSGDELQAQETKQAPPASSGEQSPLNASPSIDDLIGPAAKKRAQDGARSGLQEHVYSIEQWSSLRGKISPGEPVLVERIDVPDCYYFIVPMNTGQGGMPVAVSVDAFSGEYQESIIAFDLESDAIPHIDPAAQTFINRRVDLGNSSGPFLVRSQDHYKHLVWQPSAESFTPFLPFHLFANAGQQVYFRVDDQITPDGQVINPIRAFRTYDRQLTRGGQVNKVITLLDDTVKGG